jgi:hypothetical protein
METESKASSGSSKDNGKPFYIEILETLGLSNGELPQAGTDRWNGIIDRLLNAHKEFHKESANHNPVLPFDQNDLFAINQCLHLATSLVLLTSNDDNIESAKIIVQKKFPDRDPTTFLTISMLFNLLRFQRQKLLDSKITESAKNEKPENHSGTDESTTSKSKDKLSIEKQINILQDIEMRFARINWMIGKEDAKTLGIIESD